MITKCILWNFKIRLENLGDRNRTPRSQKVTLDFKKIPEGLEMNKQSLNYFPFFGHGIRVIVSQLVLND